MASLVVACELLVVARVWDLVPRPGIKPGPPALGVQSLIHCATRDVPPVTFSQLKPMEVFKRISGFITPYHLF